MKGGPATAPPKQEPRILRYARFDAAEISGSLGDLGTFLPLLLAMAAQNGLDFGTSLFFAGLFNLATGLLFAIPMAVQPMKAIAAVALTQGLTAAQIVAAGATVSAVVLILGALGLMERVSRAIPASLVRGLQLALGLSLVVKGAQSAASTPVIALAAGLVGLASFRVRRLPSALILFAAGLAMAAWARPDALRALDLAWSLPRWTPPSWIDFATAFPKAALPQIPLTLLNSVVAVCALSQDLFPDRPAHPRKVAVSVGLMNLVGAGFGAMPMCHGAGGLAGQYLFGARTNGAVLFLGAAKLAVAVAFGATLIPLCRAFPGGVLGVMLACSGIELALVCRDQGSREAALAMLTTAGVSLAFNNAALGLAVGAAVHFAVREPAGRLTA
jgi:predicted benzoate:H+ symporter BenE